jgi:hypothetical protein
MSDSTLMVPDEDESTNDFLNRMLNRKPAEKRLDSIHIRDLNRLTSAPKDSLPAAPLTRKEKREARRMEKKEKKK